MKPPPFTFLRATREDDAVAALGEAHPRPMVLAGGQTLLPLLNRRALRPRSLVDISGVREWSRVTVQERLSIGAAVTQFSLEQHGDVQRRLPVLTAALRHVGSLPVRVRGTWVGSLAYAHPCAELPMIAALLDGDVEVVSTRGTRRQRYRDYLLDREERIAGDEVIRAFDSPLPRWADSWGFAEVSARQNDRPVAAAAVLAQVEDGVVSRFSAAMCGEELGQVWMDSGQVHAPADELPTACADWLETERGKARNGGAEASRPTTFGPGYAARVAAVALTRAARSAAGLQWS